MANKTASEAFAEKKAEIDRMLARLQVRSSENFEVSNANWGHVGTLSHYASLLKQITDCEFKEGEHAE